MKLLLHCCCAPCTVSCAGSLRRENIEPHLFWYNPNIHPYTEYSSRRGSLSEFAANENLKLETVDEYGLRTFLDTTVNNDSRTFAPSDDKYSPENRCKECYRMRLEKTASAAANQGYGAFSTTLLISPYQDHEAVKLIGGQAAAKYGINFFYRDFRPLFREGQKAARNIGLYMQKYCGCIFSEEERYLKNSLRKGAEA